MGWQEKQHAVSIKQNALEEFLSSKLKKRACCLSAVLAFQRRHWSTRHVTSQREMAHRSRLRGRLQQVAVAVGEGWREEVQRVVASPCYGEAEH